MAAAYSLPSKDQLALPASGEGKIYTAEARGS